MTTEVRTPSPVRLRSRPRMELVGAAERTGLSDHGRAVLRRAAACADQAPAARDHAPWRHQLDGDGLTFWVEAGGPLGRWDATAAGSALFHARASIANQSMRSVLTRFPDGPGSPCFARLDPPVRRLDDDFDPTDDHAVNDIDVTPLVRGFAPPGGGGSPVSRALANYLSVASAADGVVVVQLVRRDHCEAVAGLIRRAGAVPGLAGPVGVEGWHQTGGSGVESPRAARIPAARRGGGVPAASPPRGERSRRTMLLLGTASDGPAAWLRAGEALERVRLILAHYDYASTPLTRVVEVPETRAALRRGLGLTFQPQVLLLVGQGGLKGATLVN